MELSTETGRRSNGRSMRRGAVALVCLAMAAFAPGNASAAAAPSAGMFTTFDLGSAGYGGNAIAAGPDGNMWFTNNANNSIGVITPKGSVKYFPVPTDPSQTSGPGLFAIAAGPDGNMWFTGFYANVIGKVTASGAVTLYPVPLPNSHPLGITPGPDGNLWFTMDFANGIGRITPNGVVTLFPIPSPGVTGITAASSCVMCGYLIAAGPLDSMWFTIPAVNLIGRITVAGVVTTFPVTTSSSVSSGATLPTIGALTTGADGLIYITQNADSMISGMTVDGAITNIPLPSGAQPISITPGPSDTLWVSEAGANSIGRLVVPGAKVAAATTQFRIPTANSNPTSVATGPDGKVWFTNVVSTSAGVYNLQVGNVSTGFGPLLTAKVSGQPKAGSKLTCTKVEANTWPTRSTRYQWLRNGQVITGQNGKAFTPADSDKGDKISCRVSVTYAVNLNQLGAVSKAVTIQS